MRTKALLIGATSPFLGPKVFLERGDWTIDCGDGIGVNIIYNEDTYYNIRIMTVKGPASIRVELFQGEDVSLEARQLAHA